MTAPHTKSLKVLAAAKPHGPLGKGHAHSHGSLPPSSPGPLGKNDVHEGHVNGIAAGLPGLAVKGAIHGTAAEVDPLRKAVAISRTNFQYLELSKQSIEVSNLFHELGLANRTGDDDRKKMNGVVRRLSVPIPKVPSHGVTHEVDLLHEIYVCADREQLNPIFLTAVMFTEAQWPTKLPKSPDNFDFIGMDRFELELDDMIAEHLLSADFKDHHHFKHTGDTRMGERGAVYKQIQFKDVTTTIQAFAGMMKHRRNLLLQDLGDFGLKASSLSPDELDFWNYVYYNAGGKREAYLAPDGTKEKAVDYLANGYLHLKEEAERAQSGANPGRSLIPTRIFQLKNGNVDSRDVAQRMLLIKKLLQKVGMADPSDPATMKFKLIEDIGKILEQLNRKSKQGSLLDL